MLGKSCIKAMFGLREQSLTRVLGGKGKYGVFILLVGIGYWDREGYEWELENGSGHGVLRGWQAAHRSLGGGDAAVCLRLVDCLPRRRLEVLHARQHFRGEVLTPTR